jgi:hypothetical protein
MTIKLRTQQWQTIYDRSGRAWSAPVRQFDMDRMNDRSRAMARTERSRFRVEGLVEIARVAGGYALVLVAIPLLAIALGLCLVADRLDGGRRVG